MKLLGALLTVLTTAVLPATATPVTAFVTYDSTPLGIFGDWSIHFTSGDPSVQITEVKITLNSTLFFDSAAGGFGFPTGNIFLPFTSTSGAAALVGLVGNNAANNPADGGKVLDLHFTNFTVAASVFNFSLDVDKDNPLHNCAHLGILATIVCNAANVVIATDNSLVSGSDFNGSQVEIFFGGGPAVTPTSITSTFSQTGFNQDQANLAANVTVVPEPSSIILLSAALPLVLRWRRLAHKPAIK